MAEKKTLSAKAVLRDIKAGMPDEELMAKYEVSAAGLQTIFRKLIQAKLLNQADLDSRYTSPEQTVDIIPDEEISPVPQEKTQDILRDLAKRFNISPEDLARLKSASVRDIKEVLAKYNIPVSEWKNLLGCYAAQAGDLIEDAKGKVAEFAERFRSKYLTPEPHGDNLPTDSARQALQASLEDEAAQTDAKGTKRFIAEVLTDCLFEAVRAGDLPQVSDLLRQNADVNATDESGRTLLMIAASNGHLGIAEFLLAHGAHVDLKEKSGRTALDEALSSGHTTMAEMLTSRGATPGTDQEAEVERETQPEEQPKWLCPACGKSQDTQFAECSACGFVPIEFRQRGRAEEVMQPTWGIDSLALLTAARDGILREVEALITGGADVNVRDQDGYTPLMFAASNGYNEVAKVLLEKGARTDAISNEGQTALSLAEAAGYSAIVELINTAAQQQKSDAIPGDLFASPFIIIALLFCCFPVGFYGLYKTEVFSRSTKAIIAVSWCVLMAWGWHIHEAQQRVTSPQAKITFAEIQSRFVNPLLEIGAQPGNGEPFYVLKARLGKEWEKDFLWKRVTWKGLVVGAPEVRSNFTLTEEEISRRRKNIRDSDWEPGTWKRVAVYVRILGNTYQLPPNPQTDVLLAVIESPANRKRVQVAADLSPGDEVEFEGHLGDPVNGILRKSKNGDVQIQYSLTIPVITLKVVKRAPKSESSPVRPASNPMTKNDTAKPQQEETLHSPCSDHGAMPSITGPFEVFINPYNRGLSMDPESFWANWRGQWFFGVERVDKVESRSGKMIVTLRKVTSESGRPMEYFVRLIVSEAWRKNAMKLKNGDLVSCCGRLMARPDPSTGVVLQEAEVGQPQ